MFRKSGNSQSDPVLLDGPHFDELLVVLDRFE